MRQIAVLLLLASPTISCAPVIDAHGYFPRGSSDHKPVEPGSHTKQEIENMMGSPSTIAAFDDNTWYYINSISHTYAWKAPVVVSRNVMEIEFDEETGMVKSVNNYDIKDGRVIAYAGDVTPTRGRELSFVEQLLGNVGQISTEDFDDQQEQERRRR